MRYILTAFFACMILFSSASFAQTELQWKPLVISQHQRIWYEEPTIDTSGGSKIQVWVLQMHTPPLSFNEIPEKIYRSKTLYGINLATGKYGIFKVVYYDLTNKELYNFDYHPESYPDEMKYTYPVKDNSNLNILLQKISKSKVKGLN